MSGRTELIQVLRQVLDLKEDRIDIIPGALGRYNDSGVKEIEITGRPGFVWVRIRGQTSEVIQAFNEQVGLQFGLPVLLIQDPLAPRYYRIISRDIGKYQEWNSVAVLPRHGDQHSFSDSTVVGRDITFIYKRQMMQPLLCRPQDTYDMTVYVESDYYFWAGQFKKFAGGSSASLAPLLPSAGAGKWVTVYLDGGTNTIQLLSGAEFLIAFSPADITTEIAEIDPLVGIPLAAVFLTASTTKISWSEIYDIRIMLFSGSGVSPLAHGLDPVFGYHTGNLPASNITIVDAGNYYTGTNVESVLQELGHELYDPDGHIISDGSGTYTQRKYLEFSGATISDIPARNATNIVAGATPSGPAGGDLAGTYPNPSVVDDSHAHTAASIVMAPANAQYVVLAVNSILTQERVLTGTANQITVTDGGAGGAVTLSLPQDIHAGASPTFTDLTLTGGDLICAVTFTFNVLNTIATTINAFGAAAVINIGYPGGVITSLCDIIIQNTAPGLLFRDTTASAKSLTIVVNSNVANLREDAGASGSLLVLDLANNRVGIRVAPDWPFHVYAVNSSGAADFIGNLTDVSQSVSGAIVTYAYRAIGRATHTTGTLGTLQVNSAQAFFSGSGGSTTYGEVLTANASVSAGATVSNLRMIRVYSPSNSGTISNLTGLWLGDMSAGGDNFSIYSEGGNMYHADRVGLGVITPTAVLHLRGGTTVASTAPLKFISGLLLTVAEAGAIEFLTNAYYATITTGAVRKTFAFLESPVFTGVVTIPTPFTLGAISVTATGTELNYVAGVTSAIQTQLGFKAPLASPVFTGTVEMPAFKLTTSPVSGYVLTSDGVGVGTWQTMKTTLGTHLGASGVLGTNYIALFSASLVLTSGQSHWTVPFAGTIKRFYVRTTSTQGSPGSLVFTFRIGTADQTLAIVVPAGSAAALWSNLVDSFAVTAGQSISIKVVNNAVTESAGIGSMSVELDPS